MTNVRPFRVVLGGATFTVRATSQQEAIKIARKTLNWLR
jgi:hypothetical protein